MYRKNRMSLCRLLACGESSLGYHRKHRTASNLDEWGKTMSVECKTLLLFSIALCLVVVVLATTTFGVDDLRFTVEVEPDLIYLWRYTPVEKPLFGEHDENSPEWDGWRRPNFIRILHDGKPPEQGTFNVNGKPVVPQVVVVSRNPLPSPSPKARTKQPPGLGTEFNGLAFNVRIDQPGTCSHNRVPSGGVG